MHMMSKKDLSSDELDSLRRSRNPTVVRTANGEVHTNEEAQVFVHDLNLFVTVQLSEETLPVLSLGKLCEDHGFCKQYTLTRHLFLVFVRTCNDVSHDTGSSVCARHLIHVSCA